MTPPVDSAAREDLVGTVLHNTYRLERLIGRGGMGAVYEAAHLRLSRRMAVKVLDHAMARNKHTTARFQREAETMSAIGHPHVVEVIDFNQTAEGAFYMVMELLDGEDLGRRLRRLKRFTLPQVASILRQSASALHAAHERSVVHRDLKPPNIFLCRGVRRDDFVKLVDFGICKVQGSVELTRARTIMGTPYYMSPEQVGGAALVDQRSDVYAMGAIVYELLAGVPPFTADSLTALLHKVAYDDPLPLRAFCPDLPEVVEAVIAAALAKQREARPGSMPELWEAFARALRRAGVRFAATTDELDPPDEARAGNQSESAPRHVAPLFSTQAATSPTELASLEHTGTLPPTRSGTFEELPTHRWTIVPLATGDLEFVPEEPGAPAGSGAPEHPTPGADSLARAERDTLSELAPGARGVAPRRRALALLLIGGLGLLLLATLVALVLLLSGAC